MEKLAEKRNFIEDHKGFSLVEFIVVMAIMAILLGASVTLIGNLHYANLESAVESLHAMLEKQRVTTMSKEDDWYLYIYRLTDGYYMMLTNEEYGASSEIANKENGTKICSGSIQITAGSSGTILGSNDMVRISYLRNGVFSDESKVFVSGNVPEDFFDAGNREGRIVFTGRGSHNVTLYKDTGKNFIDEP